MIKGQETTTIEVFKSEQYEGDWMPNNLAGAVNWLSSKLADIPIEYQSTAIIEIDTVSKWGDDHHARIAIGYTRPETPDESEARQAALQKSIFASLEWARRRVREEEERLTKMGLKI